VKVSFLGLLALFRRIERLSNMAMTAGLASSVLSDAKIEAA
jgi:hypothetical protein